MNVPRPLMLLLLAILMHGAAAQEAKFVSSRHSPLKQSGVIEPNQVTFSGNAQITGTFEVIWEAGTEGYPGYFRVVFQPDKASREILPHDVVSGPANEIWLRNTDAAISAFLTPDQRKQLMASRTRHATGTTTIVIKSYRTGVDCDQRGYNALFVSVVRKPNNVVAGSSARTSPGGC